RAVSREAPRALRVRRQDRPVHFGILFLEPRQKRRPEIEAHRGVVVDDRDDPVLGVENAGVGVGRVALRRDALVPVVVRVRGGLAFDRLEPRILAWRLVEVPVNADEADRLSGARRADESGGRWRLVHSSSKTTPVERSFSPSPTSASTETSMIVSISST